MSTSNCIDINHVLLCAGTKFRRISSNKNQTRSASTGNILSSFPPSYQEVITAYNAPLGQGPKGRSKVHRNSSSSQGGSFNPLHADGVVGYSAYSITGATSLDSVNPNDYERCQRDRPVSYTHSHLEGPVSRDREAREGSIGASEGRGRASHVPPSHALLDSSRESFQSGRGLGLYARHSHLRDSMSQDIMGEREFDYQLRYNANTSTTLPTLSLQDTYHSRDHSKVHGRGGRERAMSASNERDLRRKVQEFDVMPIHEGFTHRAMMTPAAVGGPSPPAHLSPHSPHQTSPDTNGRGISNGGGAPVIIDRQPRASAVEAEHNQSPRNDARDGFGGDVQQLTYHPVFFSPETGQLFMHIGGSYKPLPNQYFTDNVSIPRGTSFNQVFIDASYTSTIYTSPFRLIVYCCIGVFPPHAVRSTFIGNRVERSPDLFIVWHECPLRLLPLLHCHDDTLHHVSQCGGCLGLLTSSTLVFQKGPSIVVCANLCAHNV